MIRALFLPLFGLLTLPALCQSVTVTVGPLATSLFPRTARRAFLTPRNIPSGLAVRSVSVCAPPGTVVGSSTIIQGAMRSNALLFSAGAVDQLALRRSIAQITTDVAEFTTLSGAFVVGGDVVKLRPTEQKETTASLIFFSGLCHWLSGKIAPSATTVAAQLRAYELPNEVSIPASGCWQGSALGEL